MADGGKTGVVEPPGRWADLVRPRYAAATTTLCLGVALFAFNEFLVTTSMPTAVTELGGVALIAWTVTVYLLGAIVGGAGAALLKGRYGARATLIASAMVFLAGTLAAAAASSMPEVLVGRTLQGLGEGVIAALCYTLIPELFPSRLVPKVFGAEAIVWALAAFGGPLVAGWITEAVSWRAAFLINLPMVAIFVGLTAIVVPRSAEPVRRPSLPIGRLAVLAAAILAVAVAGIVAAPAGKVALVVAAGIGLIAVVRIDRASVDRMFPREAFGLGSVVGVGLWVALLMPLAQASIAVYLILTLQRLWGYGPLEAGVVGAVMALTWSLAAILVANLRRRQLQTVLVAIGPGVLVAGMAAVAAAFALGSAAGVILGQMAIGAAYGVSWGYLSQRIMEAAGDGERDRASALVPTIQSAGYALGAAIGGVVANAAGYPEAVLPGDIRAAALTVFGVATLISLLAFLAALKIPRLVRDAPTA